MIDIDKIIKEPLIQKYMYEHTRLSGGNTIVSPITIYKNCTENTIEVRVQIKTKINYFKGLLGKYTKYDNYLYGWFDKTDNSCPSVLILKFTTL